MNFKLLEQKTVEYEVIVSTNTSILIATKVDRILNKVLGVEGIVFTEPNTIVFKIDTQYDIDSTLMILEHTINEL